MKPPPPTPSGPATRPVGAAAGAGSSKSELGFSSRINSVSKSAHIAKQPSPATPGISKQVVRRHAQRLFRDKWPDRPLSLKEWRLAEADLIRKLEADAL